MEQHPDAKLIPKGRETLVSRIESGLGVAEAARQMGISRQTACKWLRRSRSGEELSDRSSRPRRPARLTPPEVEERVCGPRSSMLLAPLGLAAATGVLARTCARIVSRRGMLRLADVDRVTGELRRCGPATPVRYERERPGELLHVDVKKVARIPDGGGHRALGRGCGSARGAGAACLHVAVDDFSRVSYAAFMGRCLRFFGGMGVRVERMNRTLAQEWQYAGAWDSEAGGADALPAFMEYYNWNRPHSACGGCRQCRASWAQTTYRHTTTSCCILRNRTISSDQ